MIFRLYIRKAIVVLIIVSTISLSLYSEELTNKEIRDKMTQAQAFFDDRDLDNAIRVLAEIVDGNPERLDQAVNLMSKITEIKNLWNDKYDQLIDALYVDEDPAKALTLIEEMESLDSNPNKFSRAAIRNGRISAELVVNKLRLREIMAEAKIQLDQKKYSGALTLYNTGFELGRQTFQESTLVSDIDRNAVFRNIEDIQNSAAKYLVDGLTLLNQVNNVISKISTTSPENLNSDLNNLINLFNQFSSIRGTFLAKSRVIDEKMDLITARDKNAPERFFLDFSRLLIHGQNTVDYFEGIISTTDIFWEDQFLALAKAMDQKMKDSYNSTISEYNLGNFDNSLVFKENTLKYAVYSISIYELLENRIFLNKNFSLDDYSSDLVQKYYGKLVDARILARVSDSYSKMIGLRKGFADYDLSGAQSIEELYALRTGIVADLPIIDQEETLWDTIGGSINWLENYNAKPEISENVYNLVRSDLTKLKNEMRAINLAILIRLTDQEYARITNSLNGYQLAYNENKTIIDGIIDSEVAAYTGDDQLKSTFPDIALPNLVTLLENLSLLTEDTNEIIDTFENSGIEIAQGSIIEEFLNKTKAVLPRIDILSNRTEELEILARDNIFKADGLENQGSKMIDNVRAIVSNNLAGREDYDRARENLKDANNAFFMSFSFKENLDLRKRVDDNLAGLQQLLLDGENRLVVVDVRNFINQGKNAYLNRQYGQSRVFLERAQNRWLTTNTEDHPEILYWQALVDLALQFDRGRTISKTEPLYDEMTQFLNLAYSNYSKGVNLISRGDRTAGLEALDGALNTLENVTIYMPKNESAALLRLKIAQLIDPEQFRESFSIRIDDAWQKLQSNNKGTQGEGYLELIDLSKIDAKYPGLQNKISIAEYDILETRKRPPNPKDLADSATLYGRALAIVEGNIRSQFEIAGTYLNQAIALNPNNIQAISLKDKIEIDTGGTGTIVLPPALEKKFKEAQELFELESWLSAYQIILELKKDSRSADYPQLLKLEERVKLKLQI
ncbi:MAG: hypothetical protein PF518_14090 [Spirochaetaceae bacterium]|nr:hypothetical protein [Spirochaetaceae bacterium]